MAFGFQLPTYGQKKDEEEKKLPMQSKVPMQSKIPSKETTPTPSVMTSNKADIIPRQPMMSYNIEGTIMPGVSDKTAINLQKYAKENSKSTTEEKILLDEMYQEAVKVQQRKLYEKDRSEMKADMGYKAYNATDPEEKKRLTTAVQLANLSDILREGAKKEGFDAYSMNDKDLIVAYGEANPDKQQMIVDYLNKNISSMEVARQIGVIEEEEVPVVEEDKGFLGRLWDGVKGTAEGISKAGEGGTNLLDKLLGIEELTNATQYSYDTYGMSPMDLAKQDPEKYNQYKYDIEQGVADKYKTSISEDVLDLGQGTLAAASTAAAPGIIAGITVAGATKSGGEALEIVAKTFGTIGKVINMIPGLSDFRNSLPEEKKAEFDMFVGGIVGALLLGTKGKANIIKNPKQFVIDNIGSKQIINNFKENVIGITKPVVGATKNINKAPEIVARKLTKTSSPQDKLFKAQNPTLNVLNKNRNFKTIRAESDLANELIVKKGHKPVDTETRRIAHEDTMKSKRAEVESRVKNKKDLMVDQTQFAEIIEDTVADVKKSGLVKNTADIKALEAEAKAMRKQQFIDLPSLEKKKQYINGIVNNWGDSAIGDVYKNGMKKVTRAIGEVEDSTIAKIPGEFSNLKKEFGALKATYEDILKADLKNQKAKGLNIMESYSRIEGIGDILGGTLSIFTKGSAGLADVVKGVGKLFMGKVLKKMKDSDFLIEQGFNDLSSKIKPNATKIPSMNNTTKPIGGMRQTTSKVQINKAPKLPKAKNESIPQNKVIVKAPEVDTSYRIGHQIDINKSSPITSIDGKKIDTFVDEFKRQYGYPALKSKDLNKFKEIMKNPDADIKIYRASPKNELNQGDWVTIDKTYANDIKRQNGGKVYEYNVKAKDLLYPNTIEGFNELPSLNKRGAFQYNKSKGLPVKNKSIPQLKATVKAPEVITSKELSKKFTGRDVDYSELDTSKIEGTIERISKDWNKSKINIDKLEYDFRGDMFEQPEVSMKKVKDIYNKIKKGEEIPPIMINQQGSVIDGNHRVLAYKLAGIDEIPVYMPSNIKLDKINNLGTRTQGYSKLFDENELFGYKEIKQANSKGLKPKK